MTTREEKETTRRSSRRAREDKLLVLLIGIPIIVLLLISAGPVILEKLKSIIAVIVPNVWTVVIYIYVAAISFIIGRRSSR